MDASNLTKSALFLTKKVTTKWKSRLAGSDACLESADFLEKELSGFCDQTKSEEFKIRPGSFLGYIRINIVLYFLSLLALIFHQFLIALITANLSVLITVLQFFFYKEFIDFLYPRKTGKNVYGTIEPSGEVKQQIIISGHHDSAHIFNFLEENPKTYNRKVISGTLTQFGMFILSWILFIVNATRSLNSILFWIVVGILALASYNLYHLWYFYDKKRGTPGAGDNLVCVALAIEIGKYFAGQKKNGNELKHTKLIIASWDAEECGLRGARDFAKKHEQELKSIKTYNFNLECMYDSNEMHFLKSDLNGFVSLSVEMAKECSAVAEKLGYPVNTISFPMLAGGTDAAEFAKKGIETTTLVAMDWHKRDHESVYHTTKDTVEAVDKKAVKRSIEIGIEYIKEKDKTANKST